MFKSRYFLITLGVVLLITLLLLLGAVLGLDPVYQLIGVIVILVVFIVVLAVGFIRANQSADQIEKSIKAQAEAQLQSARPDKRAEIEALQEQLERAIEQLKQSRLGRGRRGKAALYALPWYMFIGPPAAGKTTAIANSGLNFPLGAGSVQGVGGTRNCDWFFSDSAILLDTAGRYTTEYDDNEEWLAFLETLCKHRREQPINGVLVGISMADLVAAEPNEIDWHAETMRRRIDELVKHLGVRFPVYLIFTKCDLLQGFAEFFGDLTRAERDQVWGATFDPGELDAGDVGASFEAEFDRLYDALTAYRLERLSRPMKREERNKVYAFPLQFEAAKDPLSRFVRQLFLPNPYQDTPVFRGFYLTSGTQEGIPIDRVIQALAHQFNLGPAPGAAAEPTTETKSYFIRDVFTEVVIPDRYLVERSKRATRERRLLRTGVAVAATIGLVLFTVWALVALRGGLGEIDGAERAASAFQTVNWTQPATVRPGVAALDSLRLRIVELEDGRFFSLGLRPRAAVRDSLERLYQRNLRAFVAAYPLRAIERQLTASRSGMERADKDTLFKDLKTYLLLTRTDPDLESRRDSLVGANTFDLVRRLGWRASGAASGPTMDGTPERAVLARHHVQAFVEALAEGRQEPFAGPTDRVDRARAAIGDIDEGVYYLQVVDNVESRLTGEAARMELRDMVRAGSGFFVNDSLSVPGVFTRGARGLVMDEIQTKSANPYSDNWVLGRQQRATVQLEDLEQKLKVRYYTAYATAWRAFLRSVQLRDFETLDEAQTALETFASTSASPVVRLLGIATVETDVCNRVAGLIADAGLADAAEVVTCDGEVVNEQFGWLHAFQFNRAESGGGSADVDLLLQSFEEAAEDLDVAAGSSDEAVSYAERLLQDNRHGIGGKLRELQRTLGPSFDRRVRENLFETPLKQSGGAIIASAAGTLDDRWRRDVYEPFQRLATLYPFNPDRTAADAAYGDAQAYFDPEDGAIAAFRTALAPFVDRGDLRRPNRWEGYGLDFSRIQPALDQAAAIGEVLGSGRIAFRIRPDQTLRAENAPAPGPLILNLHGQRRQYDQGRFREWWTFQWPGTERGLELEVAGPSGSAARISYEGVWALFRFMQAAQGEGETAPGVYARTWAVPSENGAFTFRQPLEVEVDRTNAQVVLTPARFFSFRPPASIRR